MCRFGKICHPISMFSICHGNLLLNICLRKYNPTISLRCVVKSCSFLGTFIYEISTTRSRVSPYGFRRTCQYQLEKGLATFVRLAEENPYTGTPEQIVTLCLGIDAAATRLNDRRSLSSSEEIGINDKVFSKLRVIGKSPEATDRQRTFRDVVKGLPASYSTIHVLCSIIPAELVTGIRSKSITSHHSQCSKGICQTGSVPCSSSNRWGKRSLGCKGFFWSVFRPEETSFREGIKSTGGSTEKGLPRARGCPATSNNPDASQP